MSRKTRIPAPGRGWAYIGTIIGGLVSVAANVAHSFIPPAGAPADWAPLPGAIAIACVWPLFLFIIIEVHARVQWPHGKGWWCLRWIGFPPVAGVAAFVSYRHLSGLLTYYGEEPIVTFFGPLAVDGLMITCTAALLAINHRARVAANAAATNTAAPVVTATVTPTVVPAPKAPAPVPVPVISTAITTTTVDANLAPTTEPARPVPVPVPAAAVAPVPVKARESAIPPATQHPAPASAPSTANTRVTASDAASPAPPVPAATTSRAAHIARTHLADTGKPITVNELAVRLRVGSDLAAQLLAAMDPQPDPRTHTAARNGTPVTATR